MNRAVAIVTGAGSGIGRSVALRLHQDGFSVVLAGRRPEALAETKTLAGDSDSLVCIPTDVTNGDSVQQLVDQTISTWGRIDLLFNNAGIGLPTTPIDEMSVDDWQRVVDVNLTGAFLCMRAVVAAMKRQQPQGGRIINNGSISAQAPRPHSIAYTATKHAITGLTKSMSLDGRAFNIACGQIDIGNAATDMTQRMQAGVPQANGTIASEPTIHVDHIAAAVSYMASLPLDANVPFMTVMANSMPLLGRG